MWVGGVRERCYGRTRVGSIRLSFIWDTMPDIGGYEEAREGDQLLLLTKWKKDKTNSWRMDVDVNIATNSTREDMNVEIVVEAESNSDDDSEGEIDNESESESE